MKNLIIGIVIGLVVGGLGTGLVFWNTMPSMMLEVEQSNLPFEETVSFIQQTAIDNQWQVPKIYDLKASLDKAGHSDMRNLKVLSLCQPDHAYNILSDDNNKMVSAMMPCRIGVFEDASGNVKIARMNVGLMSKMFGGSIETTMTAVADEENRMLASILKH